MNSWAPIWSGIVDSSLWEEDGDVVKVFMTMLATKTSDHVCELDAYSIAKKCNFRSGDGSVDELKVLDIIKILASPDKRRKIRQEFDGRRIRAVEGGWLILNGAKYRDMVQKEMKKSRDRKSQEAFRRRQKMLTSGTPQTGESPTVSAELNGASQEVTNQMTTAFLPESCQAETPAPAISQEEYRPEDAELPNEGT